MGLPESRLWGQEQHLHQDILRSYLGACRVLGTVPFSPKYLIHGGNYTVTLFICIEMSDFCCR